VRLRVAAGDRGDRQEREKKDAAEASVKEAASGGTAG
jgi:hypothetical protein